MKLKTKRMVIAKEMAQSYLKKFEIVEDLVYQYKYNDVEISEEETTLFPKPTFPVKLFKYSKYYYCIRFRMNKGGFYASITRWINRMNISYKIKTEEYTEIRLKRLF